MRVSENQYDLLGRLELNIRASSDDDIERSYAKYYSILADHFLQQIPSLRQTRRVLEVGSGRGQLTIPLLTKLPREARLTAMDSSKGPYVGWSEELARILAGERLDRRVRIVRSDARRLAGIRNASVDLVVSNELLCDLTTEADLQLVFAEFNRVLKSGATMVHGEWSSFAPGRPQSFIVKHWPSWSPDQLYWFATRAGFDDFRVTYFDTTITFSYEAAKKELLAWGAKEALLSEWDSEIKRYGIRLPSEHVVACRKSRKSSL